MTNSFNNRSEMNTLVEKLRQRLKNFAVVDPQGERLGEVKDVILDANNQLNLVIMRLGNNLNPQQFLLISKLIKKIEPANKTVLVIDSDKLTFPEYTAPETPNQALADLNNSNPDTSGDSDRINDTSNAIEDIDLLSTPSFETKNMQNEVQSSINIESSQQQVVLDEDIIRLLEERVVVERGKRKIGEVIVRKEVGTRMVQVPVRYEKLIVEEVGSEPRQLAEIDLSLAPVSQDELPDTAVTATKTTSSDEQSATAITADKNTSLNGELTVSGKFSSPKIASLILNAIAMERRHGCKQIRVEIVVEDEERKKTYQEWFARTSKQ
ncbi:MAG TPA: PRC-barrel domain-containing protein [Leptolyngbyaceae cyanobacterium]